MYERGEGGENESMEIEKLVLILFVPSNAIHSISLKLCYGLCVRSNWFHTIGIESH